MWQDQMASCGSGISLASFMTLSRYSNSSEPQFPISLIRINNSSNKTETERKYFSEETNAYDGEMVN